MTDTRPFALALGDGSQRLWSMSAAERLRRIFERCGLTPIETVEAAAAGAPLILARADWVFDEALIKALVASPDSVLMGPTGPVAAHLAAGSRANAKAVAAAMTSSEASDALFAGLTPLDSAGLTYNSALRKREVPVLERLGANNVRMVEARLFKGSYKGVTDLVTKYVWPVPARIVTRWCAAAGISPNAVTFASLLLVIAAFMLFWQGEFGWGLVAAWIMTFLDTVDGKLARVTLTSSKIGNVFDHGIDLVHPPFWWWAWWAGCQHVGLTPVHSGLVLAVIVGGYVLQRLEEGVFLAGFKLEMHAWRPFDAFFRLITARRNPNLILLTLGVIAGRPDIGLVAVAIWTGVCLIVHLVQIVQGFAASKPLVSWLAR